MRILLVHERYQQPGGEDHVFAAEADLLSARGHDVVRFEDDNDRIDEMARPTLAAATVWNAASYRRMRRIVRRERPAVVHFHNTFPLISPAAYHAARRSGAAVVQTLHNYRLVCPVAQLYRDDEPCEDCVGRAVPWPGVVHACYRDSREATAVTAAMLSIHRLARTWSRAVDVYVTLTEFARDVMVRGGLPAERLVVKPNFVADRGVGAPERGAYALFVGRWSREKGIGDLIEAWRAVETVPLKVVGDGPLAADVNAAGRAIPGFEPLGRRSPDEVAALMREAAFLVLPSRWYEGLPLVILEAFSAGLPVVAPDLGAMSSVVSDGRTGLHYPAGDVSALVDRVNRLGSDPDERAALGRGARREYLERYTPERSYDGLMDVYRRATGATPEEVGHRGASVTATA